MDVSTTLPLTRRDALITYQTLRIGMIGAVAFLASAVAIEVVGQRFRFESSISAYWYTPVRPVFVGTLIAIGIALIVIKGTNSLEDTLLNFAGMFAPVVALVPTRLPGQDNLTDPDVLALVRNNVAALLIVGALGIVAALVLQRTAALPTSGPVDRLRIGGAAVIYLVTLVAFAFARPAFTRWGHYVAAAAMFLCMAAVVYIASRSTSLRRPGLRPTYQWISAVMIVTLVVAAILRIVVGVTWPYLILVVEVIEIAAFTLFWALQTYEHWGNRTFTRGA